MDTIQMVLVIVIVNLCLKLKPTLSSDWLVDAYYEYLFSNETTTWNQSRQACMSMGADLASIGGAAEQKFLSDKISLLGNVPGREFWIGLILRNTPSDAYACSKYPSWLDCFNTTNNQHACCQARQQWTWTDRTQMNFMWWMINEPSSPHTCGRIAHFTSSTNRPPSENYSAVYYWFETDCPIQHRYICKRPLTTSLPTQTSPSVAPTHSKNSSNKPYSPTTAIAVGVAIGVCLLIVAILVLTCFIRRRREKQALAKTHVTIVPVDAPSTKARLQYDSSTHGTEHTNTNTPSTIYYSKSNGTDFTNTTPTADSSYEPVTQTTDADVNFSAAHCQHEPSEREIRAAKPLIQQQVEYADISLSTPVTRPVHADNYPIQRDSYAEVQTQHGDMEYANADDITTVHYPPPTDTNGNMPKPAKPSLAVKPQPQNTQFTKETTNTPPPGVKGELPLYAVVTKKKKT